MNSIDNGGPAFPVTEQTNVHDEHVSWAESGMTLRDYFAAKAMQAIIANPEEGLSYTESAVAENAYVMADAMINARG